MFSERDDYMNIGENILKLRKKQKLSQEQLAEKLGVTRQTISNWELGESSPDLKQSKELSKIFNISLDELVGNDTKEILVERVSNTEKLAGVILTILKVIGITILVMLCINIIAIFLFTAVNHSDNNVKGSYIVTCTINREVYDYYIEYNKENKIVSSGGDRLIDNILKDEDEYNNAKEMVQDIENYFKTQNGICELEES